MAWGSGKQLQGGRYTIEKQLGEGGFGITYRARGYYLGEVPQLKACYSQGETIDELMVNIKEVIELCLEEESDENIAEFVGIQKVVI